MRPFVLRRMETQFGEIDAQDLWAWDRNDLPGPALAREVRDIVIRRRRPSFDRIWASTISVRLPEDWRRALSDEERLRLLPLVADDDAINAFPERTLREVKDALRLPVADVLGILAKIEALYWVATPVRRAPAVASQNLPDVTVDKSFVDQVRHCLSAPWLVKLDPGDLRFPAINGQSVDTWLEPQLRDQHLSGIAHGLCKRLLAANEATWADELRDIAVHAIENAEHRPGSELARIRWIDIFVARHGGVEGKTLAEIGTAVDLTRERVRQITEYMLSSLRMQPVKMPALERVLGAAGRIMPLPIDDANVQLARFLGDGQGLAAAMKFAEIIGLPSTVRLAEARALTSDGYRPVPILEATASPSTWMNAALSFARRDCTSIGCSNFIRIAGFLALQEGVAQDLETLRSLLEAAPGFRMLDSEAGWFTLADSENSAAAARMRKLMSVSGGSTDLDTVASALMTDDRWFNRDAGASGWALAIPPVHVLSELFAGWAWLSSNAHNRYTTIAPIKQSSALSRTEACAVDAVLEMKGAATRAEIASRIMSEIGVTSMAVSFTLATSPALLKLEHGIYGIRGLSIPIEGLAKARMRRAAERASTTKRGAPSDLAEIDFAKPHRTVVTQSASSVVAYRRVVYLPRYLVGKVKGRFDHAGSSLPPITVGARQQIRGLAAAAERVGILPGATFELEFDPLGRTYEIFARGLPSTEPDPATWVRTLRRDAQAEAE